MGIASAATTLYGVVAEAAQSGAHIRSYHEVPLDTEPHIDMTEALRVLIAESGVADIAVTLPVGDAWIARLPGQEHLHRSKERQKAARLFAEREGFSATSSVRVVRTRDGVFHLAVAASHAVDALARLVHGAGGRVAFMDHEGYAWAPVMPPGVQALVVATADDVRVFVFSEATVEAGRFGLAEFAPVVPGDEFAERKIARAIAGAILRAAQDGFVDVQRVAVLEAGDSLTAQLLEFVAVGVSVEPYAFGDAARTPYARAAGAALRAAGAADLQLYVNFFDSRSRWDEARARVRAVVAPSDLAMVGTGAVAALALFAWRAETVQALNVQASQLEARVVFARRDASVIDRELAAISSARAVVRRVDDARRSGPLVARDIARITRGIGSGLSATTLSTDQTGWTLTGHAREFPQIARLMAAMSAAGFTPSLTGSEQQGDRVAYAVTFPRASGAPAP